MLLGTRSIVVQILILGITATVRSQQYDPELHATNEELDDNSEYTGDENAHAHPDYSKYFALDKSSTNIGALVQGGSESGFVAPIEFSSFFGTPNFAFDASNKQEVLKPIAGAEVKNDKIINGFVTPEDFRGSFSEYDANGFGAQDYFEQAQKQQKAENEEEDEISPGPSYISHRVPSHSSTRSEDENDYETPINSKIKNYDAKDKEEDESDNVEQIENYESPRYTSNFKPSPVASAAQFQPSNPGKGLLSVQELNSLPYVSQVYNNFAPNEAKPTPYQKYSFQPAGSNLALKQAIPKEFQSTPAPYNPSYLKTGPKYDYQHQSSESIPQNIKRDCIKVNKQVSNRNSKLAKQPMQCFVCKDPKSGAKYERCSYSNEPTPKSYYTSTSHSHGNPEGYRNKRDESESYVNPYDEVKAKSHEYYSQPDEFEKNFYKAPNFDDFSNEGYSFSPESKENEKEAEEKSSSEIQSQELLKQKDNCKKSHKNGVTCTVCTNAKTGANYEQCSYESEPNEKKYAYVSEKKFDGDGNPVEDKEEDGDESKSVEAKQEPSSQEDEVENYEETEDETKENTEEEDGTKNSKLSDKDYNIPSHFEEDTFERQNFGVRGLDPKLYGSLSDSPKDEKEERGPQKFEHIDDYHLKLFPQLNNQESRTKESRAKPENPYFEDLTAKKDVEKVLEEFSKKDRSNCKQVSKKGMTCYLCVDKHGIQQEECMYVSESKPQSSHVAYHEVQHLKVPEKNNASEAESQVKPVLVKENGKRKTFFKKATTAEPIDSEENPSNYEFKKITTEKTNENKSKIKRSTNSKAAPKKSSKNEDPEPQFDINDEGGLYSAETAPVYSKELGLTLSKYIVEKSPIEIEFDR